MDISVKTLAGFARIVGIISPQIVEKVCRSHFFLVFGKIHRILTHLLYPGLSLPFTQTDSSIFSWAAFGSRSPMTTPSITKTRPVMSSATPATFLLHMVISCFLNQKGTRGFNLSVLNDSSVSRSLSFQRPFTGYSNWNITWKSLKFSIANKSLPRYYLIFLLATLDRRRAIQFNIGPSGEKGKHQHRSIAKWLLMMLFTL